jgi:hypothetical protein
MYKLTVYRPKGNLAFGFVALGFVTIFMTQAIFYPAPRSNLVFDIAAAALIGFTATVIWIRPKLILDDKHLVVVNPFKTATIAYSDITELETKWALLIHHGESKTRVWVAPASGKQRWARDSTLRWGFDRIPTSERNEQAVTNISQSLNSDSGVAAHLIRERLKSQH